MIMQSHSSILQAIRVLPLPPNGSKITGLSVGGLTKFTKYVINLIGLTVGCMFLTGLLRLKGLSIGLVRVVSLDLGMTSSEPSCLSLFKAFGRALMAAVQINTRLGGSVPSSKGVL